MMYQVELVWNREFDFVPYGDMRTDLDEAIELSKLLESMGDGAVVKKTRIVDGNGNIVYQHGRKVT